MEVRCCDGGCCGHGGPLNSDGEDVHEDEPLEVEMRENGRGGWVRVGEIYGETVRDAGAAIVTHKHDLRFSHRGEGEDGLESREDGVTHEALGEGGIGRGGYAVAR